MISFETNAFGDEIAVIDYGPCKKPLVHQENIGDDGKSWMMSTKDRDEIRCIISKNIPTAVVATRLRDLATLLEGRKR